MAEDSKPRVRFAPSPTGPFHIGNARAALYNWLFARQKGGTFVLRIEDTDKARSEKRFEDEIIEGLRWLGLQWDEGPDGARSPGLFLGGLGPYRQSERGEIYKKYLTQLLDEGKAYRCYCAKETLEAERQAMLSQGLPPKYGGHCRDLKKAPAGKKPEAIRFRVPETGVEFTDIVRGKVKFDAALFGDLVIAKNLDAPLFTFANVVDDELMKITHVIRGEDHLSNTPKQILIQRALGFKEPAYAHLPLLLSSDRKKLSKRAGDTALLDYRKRGYLPSAVVNFLALLGWHPQGNEEVFDAKDLAAKFDLARVQKGGAVFNEEKLDWLNREHMKQLADEELMKLIRPFAEAAGIAADDDAFLKIIRLERGRMTTLADFAPLAKFFFALPEYDAKLLVWKNDTADRAKKVLAEILRIMDARPASRIGAEHLEKILAEEGRGSVLWPLRVALSGQEASPDPFHVIEVLSPAEARRRVESALRKLD